jgi:hypothetical protein
MKVQTTDIFDIVYDTLSDYCYCGDLYEHGITEWEGHCRICQAGQKIQRLQRELEQALREQN